MSAPEVDVVRIDAVGFARYGGPEVLHRLQVVVPAPGPGQVRVRVAATSADPADTYLRSGRFRFVLPVRRPFVPGLDVAGVVDAVGAGVHTEVGAAVFAALPSRAGGGYAGMVVVDEGLVAAAPSKVTLADAAALPLVALTALQGLRDCAGLRSGATVLVTVNPGRANPLTGVLTRLLPGAAVAGLVTRPAGSDLDQVRQWVEAGALRPWVHTRLPLHAAERAHRLLESRETAGKVVLVVDDQLSRACPGRATTETQGAE